MMIIFDVSLNEETTTGLRENIIYLASRQISESLGWVMY